MKISQYNWNCWFLTNIILLCIVMVSGMCITDAVPGDVNMLKHISIYGSVILFFSLIPCLYIGCKP